MKKTINLFLDMDGTLAKFYHDKKCLEKMYEQGYFEKLPPYAIASEIDRFASLDTCVEIYILSACIKCPYCEQEKIAWLLKHMPNIKPQNFIFTAVGESKLQRVLSKLGKDTDEKINILLDDYTKNLEHWECDENFLGVKFVNGFNDKTKTWQGERVKNFNGLMKLLQKITIFGL